MSNPLQNKVIIITGASSGIGKACAFAFAKVGCRVMLAARDENKLREIVNEIKAMGGTAIYCKTDVSAEGDCKHLIDETIKEFKRIDVLINNAGVSMRAVFADLDLKVMKQLIDINFWGAVYCTKFAIDEILKTKGSIVGVSSIAGYQGLPARTGYSASKFAMRGFLEALRVENLKTGIHVLVVCPGYTASNIRRTALNKHGKPQGDTPLNERKLMSAEAVVNGVIKRKRTILLTVQGKLTVWLGKFFPEFIDRMAFKVVTAETDSPV